MVYTTWRRRGEYDLAQVDVFSGFAFRWAEAVCAVLRRAGKPYVLTLHGGGLPRFAATHPRRVRKLLRSAAAVTTPSGYLLREMGPYAERLRLLPNAVELAAYAGAPREHAAPRLVWLRAFHEIYNPLLAVRTVALLRERFPDVRLAMAGPDSGDGTLQRVHRAVEEMGLGEHVTIRGRLAKGEIPRHLGGADVLLNTPRIDNTPVSVVEALACGLAVVSTRVGGIPDLVEDGREALLTPPDDAEAMAAAVARVLTEPGLSARLTRGALEKASSLDWPVVLPQWEALLASVTRGQP
jgi:glycosyltransferase involved in cell wall biosynthesis